MTSWRRGCGSGLGSSTNFSRHDPLTALANVRSFTEELERAVRQAARGHGSALLFVDLDRFKACNDTFGHSFGDSVLAQVAAALQSGAWEARTWWGAWVVTSRRAAYGGADSNEAMAVSERMREGVVKVAHKLGADIALSGGIAVIDGKTDARAVLTAADQAMYEAQGLGQHHRRRRGLTAPCRLGRAARWSLATTRLRLASGGAFKKNSRGPKIRFHDLGHTHVTQLLRAGVNAEVVSERLGHAPSGITLGTCSPCHAGDAGRGCRENRRRAPRSTGTLTAESPQTTGQVERKPAAVQASHRQFLGIC